jgi:hypothetical protein
MKQFVPMTDEMLFDAKQFVGAFVPYRYGVQCARQMRERETERVAPAGEVTSPPTVRLPA